MALRGKGSVAIATAKRRQKFTLFCCTGRYVDEMVIEICRATGDKQNSMEYKRREFDREKSMSPSNTSRNCPHGPFQPELGVDLTPLQRALETHGYTEAAVSETVGSGDAGGPADLHAALRRTDAATPYNTLVRLFVLARPVDEAAAQDALAPATLASLAEVGLLQREGDSIRAVAALIPSLDLLLVRDFWPDYSDLAKPRYYVPGGGLSSLTVLRMTVRREVERALDLGTGLGIQALTAAPHVRHVIGTDINARALNFAALNAKLNDISNLELRLGSLYEPVSDNQFDLIMANPPYVISPQSEYEYRDSDLPGDQISEQVIRGAPAHLREGGYCTVLFNWHHRSDDDWAERPTEWLSSNGCDCWLIRSDDEADPVRYASRWLRETVRGTPETRARLLDQWLAYYERLGIGRISTGIVVLRRRSGAPNWIRAEEAPPGRPESSCSDQIQRIFAAQDLLEQLDDERHLLDMAFALTPDHQLEQVLRAENDRWVVSQARVKQTRGFQFVGNVDRMVSSLLAGCDGQRPLRAIVADLAAGLGAEVDQIAAPCLGVVRKLLASGFLTVGGAPDDAESPASRGIPEG
jgi:methylase of polypeptide subunit release factors